MPGAGVFKGARRWIFARKRMPGGRWLVGEGRTEPEGSRWGIFPKISVAGRHIVCDIKAVGKTGKGARKMTYDLHIHSCLSPCADDDMTPANIAGFAKLNGIDLIAVADHNAARNLPAVQRACDAYGLRLLPAIEANTAEEIHVLLYFATVEAALEMGRQIYDTLPDFAYDRNIWGAQLVMDENDQILEELPKLLSSASDMDIYEMKRRCEALGGIAVPAHVDKDSTSLLSVLGFAPEDLPFEAYEVRRPEHSLQKLLADGRLPADGQWLTSSDAHNLQDISEHPRQLAEDSCLWRLLR